MEQAYVACYKSGSHFHVDKQDQALAIPQEDATHVKLVSVDGYSTLVSIKEAAAEGNYLAYEWEGRPIPVLHGFPIRVVFPELEGNKWVKWLVLIEVQ
ncbi:MAG: molybdopterin-dependent oxidoreductase [Desulfobacterales bacterium]|nr:molybdopterin-dependent oxidoreductase [Deltaproteobacteria bacterium]NNK95871.1 molybdopterin-dependent oxidoreductase [Desulfobacterales bacterium]